MPDEAASTGRRKLIFIACGNIARQDDGAGPLLLDYLSGEYGDRFGEFAVDYIETHQLNPENAYDIMGAEVAIFLDAGVSTSPISFTPVNADHQYQFSSHQQSPQAVLALAEQLSDGPLPDCYSIAIHGEKFELGGPMTAACHKNIQLAKTLIGHLLQKPDHNQWQKLWHQQGAQNSYA